MTTKNATKAEARGAKTPRERTLSCMEIWGGSQAASDAVSTPGVDFWVHSSPFEGNASGGDIHYVSVCGSGRFIRAALADVAGHGKAVSDLASDLRSLVRRHINTPDQSRFARALNDEFGARSAQGAFATAILATYHAPSESLIVCNAGHPRPLLFRSERDDWCLLDLRETEQQAPRGLRNLPLGVIEGTTYEQRVVALAPGDFVLLYSDAMIDARDPDGRTLGEQGLLDLVRGLEWRRDRPGSIIPALVEAIEAHRDGVEAQDDLTLILLRQNGTPPRLRVGETLSVVAKLLGLKSV